jgi:hypothetical protein
MRMLRFAAVIGVSAGIVIACGSDDAETQAPADAGATTDGAGPRGAEQAGQACAAASQCYGGVDGGADAGGLKGTVTCLDRVPNGYCTHTCDTDADCCAVPGECKTGVKQVCSPFTNDSATKYCFLSCEDADVNAAIAANAGPDAGYYDGGAVDGGSREDEYCKSFASVYATCRSSGGGAKNRKVCIPQQ